MNIELIGKFYDNHSLSIINRNLAIKLHEKFSQITDSVTINPLDDINTDCTLDKETLKLLKSIERRDIGNIDVQIRHSYPPIWRWPVSNDTKVIFIQGWEFSKIPFEWQYKFETFADHLVTYSNWTRDRYVESGINPNKISAINPGINPAVFNSDNRKPRNTRKFTFTFVGCGQYRKGLDILIESYKKSFTRSDNVRLIIKDTPKIYGESNLLSEVLRLQYLGDIGEITLEDSDLTDHQMADLYRETDVLVHPYRGEGFGMHVQEAMACGVFPLVTGNGATDDFVNESCGLRINSAKRLIDLTNPKVFAIKPGDSLTNMGSHGWIIEPVEEDLINKMKYLYYHHDKDSVLNVVNNAKISTWENMVNKYLEIIEKVHNSTCVFRNK